MENYFLFSNFSIASALTLTYANKNYRYNTLVTDALCNNMNGNFMKTKV